MTSAMARSTIGRNVLRRRPVVGERDVENALGLGIHVAGEIEARQIEPRRQALVLRRRGRGGDEMRLALDIGGLAVESPKLRIEHHRPQAVAVQQGLQRCRQRQSVGAADDELVGRELDIEVVGERIDHHALGRGQRAEFDEILLVDEAARRRQGGDDEQAVADVGIGDAVHLLRRLEGNGDARAIGADHVADDIERAGRIEDGIADLDRPHRAVGRRRWRAADDRA